MPNAPADETPDSPARETSNAGETSSAREQSNAPAHATSNAREGDAPKATGEGSAKATGEGNAVVSFRRVTYSVPGLAAPVIDDLSLEILRGETLVLLGESGCGKTTTLRLINRLLTPTAGEVLVEGKDAREWEAVALRRRTGYVIQDAGLFPHFTVERNVALVPTLEGWDAARTASRVGELLRLVGLEPERFAARFPAELSGGQRQRVGVARALAADPPLLLMDEPFGALDPLTRATLQREFAALQKRLGKTVVFVTHDVREALMLATRVALMSAGRIVLLDTPEAFLKSDEPHARAYRETLSLPEDFLPARAEGDGLSATEGGA